MFFGTNPQEDDILLKAPAVVFRSAEHFLNILIWKRRSGIN